MVTVVYLLILFTGSQSNSTSELIPQANMKQCEINSVAMNKDSNVRKAYCIVGVIPK